MFEGYCKASCLKIASTVGHRAYSHAAIEGRGNIASDALGRTAMTLVERSVWLPMISRKISPMNSNMGMGR